MVRYLLWIAFDGTAYHGWQIQKNAGTVQAVINEKLLLLLQQSVETTGCGRTDTGVHAREYALHFDLEASMENADDFVFKLNAVLPRDITALQLIPVNPIVHARFSAISRSYTYYLHHKKDPFSEKYSVQIPPFLYPDKMQQCADLMVGTRSFRCFCKGKAKDNYECELYTAAWEFSPNCSIFRVSANRFLRNMVRAMLGTMMEVGAGKLSIEEFKAILDNGNRSDAGVSVAAKGLFLSNIAYKKL